MVTEPLPPSPEASEPVNKPLEKVPVTVDSLGVLIVKLPAPLAREPDAVPAKGSVNVNPRNCGQPGATLMTNVRIPLTLAPD
jgi:hypothetical protein